MSDEMFLEDDPARYWEMMFKKLARENSRLMERCGELEDLLCWRDAEKEKPESSGRYLVATDGSTDISEHISYYSPLIGWSTKDAGIGWWRPIGPLPGEGGGR